LAGLPAEVPAMTINRFCSSGLQAINIVAGRIASGEIDIAIAGGVESMSMVPMTGGRVSVHPKLAAEYPQAFTPMGVTAEIVAKRFGVSRKDQDELVEGGQSRDITVSQDELVRADTTFEKLAALKPAFDPTGSVTAGNASPLTDGAAAVLVMARDVAEKRGLKVLGYLRSFACVGVDPDIMGIGPVPAIKKLLAKTGKNIKDIDLFEINEAFAAQAVYCARTLEIPADRLNVNGGAIALGHPLGATGARQAIHILAELARRGQRWGVSSMCVGGGMGAAALWERA
jgi:acetyl-CoA acyltransferase